MSVLEVYTDASIRKYDSGRTFGCAGALCSLTGDSKYDIIADTTNNRAELMAIYLGCQLINDIRLRDPSYDEFILYSDSQFGVFGLTRWIYGWLKTMDENGIIYGSNKQPVANQELFAMIFQYLVNNQLRVQFRHMAGHVRLTSQKKLNKANDVFLTSNGYQLRPEDIYKISYYNDIVDRTTRGMLDNVNPDTFPMVTNYVNNRSIMIPREFDKYNH